MPTISDVFHLNKKQAELDFVDVDLDTDVALFLNPAALPYRADVWSRDCQALLVRFFDAVMDALRAKDDSRCRHLLANLQEPNETHLGFSVGRPQGAGIGKGQSAQILNALRKSAAVQTGFLKGLADCELVIDGISHDKISDLTTNIIRSQLIDYTAMQADLWGIPRTSAPLAPCFDDVTCEWRPAAYANVPAWKGTPLLFVPKSLVRWVPEYRSGVYYRNFVLEFLRAEEMGSGGIGLARMLRNGTKKVFMKDLRAAFPFSKKFLLEFSQKHPEVLEAFRAEMARIASHDARSDVDQSGESDLARTLSQALGSIATGNDTAAQYHDLMIGAIEFIFYPLLGFPRKEKEIHEGRKRIDILVENCARSGIFHELPTVRSLSCAFVPIECKNYSSDPKNPELDQLAGRLGGSRGYLGFMCCREFANRPLFVQRCRDSFIAQRQLMVPLDDAAVHQMLKLIADNRRPEVGALLRERVNEIWDP